jgi:hypothetical protein
VARGGVRACGSVGADARARAQNAGAVKKQHSMDVDAAAKPSKAPADEGWEYGGAAGPTDMAAEGAAAGGLRRMRAVRRGACVRAAC